MIEQYAITGIGVHNSLGSSAMTSWPKLLIGQSGLSPLVWPDDDPTKYPATYSALRVKLAGQNHVQEECFPEFSKHWMHWDKNTKAGMLTVREALQDSKITSTNIGVIFSTIGGATDVTLELDAALTNGIRRVSPRKTLSSRMDFTASQVAAVYCVTGPNLAIDSACTTGIASIEYAISMMKCYPELDGMIVGAADHMASPHQLYWFQNVGAICLSSSIESSCPFNASRSGFFMGEGAATLIIEPLCKALARNASIYAIVKSCALVTVSDSDTSPDRDGKGAKLCVEMALKRADVAAADISFVNAHATSTLIGDIVEYNAMSNITPGIHMVSNKGQIGHQMAPAGLTETVYTILSMRDSIIPPNANLVDPIPGNMILPTVATPLSIQYAIKNSFGFGGRNASMVLEKYEG